MSPVTKAATPAYRGPPAHAEYHEPSEAEQREIRIKRGETIQTLLLATVPLQSVAICGEGDDHPGVCLLPRNHGTNGHDFVTKETYEAALKKAPGRGILHERGQAMPSGMFVSRFANESEREDEKMRQLEAFAKWQREGGTCA